MKPIIKWPGGKTQLMPKLLEIIPKQLINDLQDVNKTNRYVEPFLGGGAVLFALKPVRPIVNDLNQALINLYRVLQSQASSQCASFIQLINYLDSHISEDLYYSSRDKFNNKLKNNQYDEEMAVLFLFLNKHCFNGLYRVNRNGDFNVPYNKSLAASINSQNVIDIANYLYNNVQLECNDFAQITSQVSDGDLVFIDSPYPPLKDKTFSEYNAVKFSAEDHIRLAYEVDRIAKFANIIVTNHDTKLIRSLYRNFNIEKVTVARNVNCNGSNRKSEEIIITNF